MASIVKKLVIIIIVGSVIAYFVLGEIRERQENRAFEATLVTRAERISQCNSDGHWIPSVGDRVQISVDSSEGVVVFVAFGSFESFGFRFGHDRKVDPKGCTVFGIDVRTNSTRVIETSIEGGFERIAEPFAVVRFLLEELTPID